MNETINTLRERVAKLEEKAKAQDKALELAGKELDSWKKSHNKWRQENLELQSRFMTVERGESLKNEIDLRLSILEKTSNSNKGKDTAYHNVWVVVVAVASFLISVSVLILMIVKL